MIDPKVISILEDKIRVIEANDKVTCLVGPIRLPVNLLDETTVFHWYCWMNCTELTRDTARMMEKLSDARLAELQQSSVLAYGDFANSEEALIRFHSICHTGDIFGSKRCDCGYQLKRSMKEIVDHGIKNVAPKTGHADDQQPAQTGGAARRGPERVGAQAAVGRRIGI